METFYFLISHFKTSTHVQAFKASTFAFPPQTLHQICTFYHLGRQRNETRLFLLTQSVSIEESAVCSEGGGRSCADHSSKCKTCPAATYNCKRIKKKKEVNHQQQLKKKKSPENILHQLLDSSSALIITSRSEKSYWDTRIQLPLFHFLTCGRGVNQEGGGGFPTLANQQHAAGMEENASSQLEMQWNLQLRWWIPHFSCRVEQTDLFQHL